MKEVKKTAPAKNNNVKKTNASKKPITNKTAPKKVEAKHENIKAEEVKITKIDTSNINNDEEKDRKLIVLIAVAILVIIGTIIGLLVGCERKEEKPSVDEDQPKEDIVIPVDEDENNEKESKKSVVKTTTKVNEKYLITYINLDDNSKFSKNITAGSLIKKYVPKGYYNCSYYYDKEETESVNFNKAPKDDTKVYMDCSIKEFTVTYKNASGEEIKSVNVKGADTESYVIASGKDLDDESIEDRFLGWSANGTKEITYKAGKEIKLTKNLTLTAVMGVSSVTYANKVEEEKTDDVVVPEEEIEEELVEVTEDFELEEAEKEEVNEVVIGYSSEDLENYDITEITPEDVGLSVPTYFVPVSRETSGSKKVVSNDVTEVAENEIKLEDVDDTPEWYTPEVDDSVLEKEYVFDGWTDTEGEPIPDDWKPTEEEEKLEANWDFEEEDKTAPVEVVEEKEETQPEEPVEAPEVIEG